MTIFVPPGGFVAAGQQTVAAQVAQGMRRSSSNGTRKRRKKAKRKTAKRAKRKSAGRKLKFGSPAWRKKYSKKRKSKK